MFTLNDRCDDCHAAAAAIAVKGLSSLMFCQHHARKYAVNLRAQGFTLIGQDDLARDKATMFAAA